MLEIMDEDVQVNMDESEQENGVVKDANNSDSMVQPAKIEINEVPDTTIEMDTNEINPPQANNVEQTLEAETELELTEVLNGNEDTPVPNPSLRLSSSAEDLLLLDDTGEGDPTKDPEVVTEDQGQEQGTYYWRYDSISKIPTSVTVTDETEFPSNCILKGCKW